MEVLVDNLREAYRVSITDLEWMTPQTRERALQKLDKFTPKIGYPATWRDYSAITIRRDDLLGNVRRATAAECDRGLAKLAGPVDRDEWFMTPQTVNAYYNPGMNEIVFPAAILQPHSSTRMPTTPPTTVGSEPSSDMRSAMASMIRVPSTTATATWSTGGPTPTVTNSGFAPRH